MASVARKLRFGKREQFRRKFRPPALGDVPREGVHRFALSSLPENSLRAITDDVCVARIGKEELVAFDRKCPHDGSDLALGTVTDGQITCPWHNVRFDPDTGASACRSLSKVRLYEIRREGNHVTVLLGGPTARPEPSAT